MEKWKVSRVEYTKAREFDGWIFLLGNATLTLDDDSEVFCIGGVVFEDKLE